jgi:transporter family-2 protein
MPVQAALNAQLTRTLENPYLTALYSLLTGAMAVSVLAFTHPSGVSHWKKLFVVPPYLLFGGLLGAIFVGSSLILIPRMGAMAMVSAFITGQLLGSMLIDHFGLFGMPTLSLNPMRSIGLVFLITGLFLVMKRS